MNIVPMSAPAPASVDLNGNPSQSRVDSLRSMRMNVNRTPQRLEDLDPEALAQAQQADVPNDQSTAAAAVTQPLSPQLALLAKQRRALQVKERALAEREKALTAQGDIPRIEVSRLKSEPLSVLLENGVTYEQLTQAILAQDNSGSAKDINALKAEIAALREGVDKKFVDKDTQAEQQVLGEMKRQALSLVSGTDDYELVRAHSSVPTVMQLIERTYRESGEVLDVPEALQLVEDELFKDAQKLAKLKKMQAFLAPQVQEQPRPQPQQRTVGMRTLTNRDTATVPLSARARALAAFHGTLKRG